MFINKNTAPLLISIFLLTGFSAQADEKVKVTLHGKPLTLAENIIEVGKPLPDISLPDILMSQVALNSFKGKVTILSVVPSIDTPTCEKQTHILSEENEGLDQTANLVTVSRDLPFAQKRFAKEANINNILFLSDYREAEFGRASGLLIQENRLLARTVMVIDREGIIRYMEIVSELSQLPDMKKVFAFAKSLQ